MMEGTGDLDLDTCVQSIGIDTSGSFSSPPQCERSHGSKVSLAGTGAIVQKSKQVTHIPENNGISEGEDAANTDASSWNVFGGTLRGRFFWISERYLLWFSVHRRCFERISAHGVGYIESDLSIWYFRQLHFVALPTCFSFGALEATQPKAARAAHY